MRIIGIDPGSRFTGYGVIEQEGQQLRHITSGRINATAGPTFAERLEIIYNGLTSILAEWPADHASVETTFTAKNAQSTIKLGHARGVALLALRHQSLPIHEYAPALIKKSVAGSGRANKAQVTQMVKLRLNLQVDLSSDAADALAIAICHSQVADFHQRLS